MRSNLALVFLLLAFLAALTGSGRSSAADDGYPMNVEYQSLDANGFAVNPSWTFQRTHANDDPPFPQPLDLCDHFKVSNTDDPSHPSLGNPPCTNQPYTVDYPYGFHDFACVNFGGNQGSLHGHIDWFPAQYSGVIYWGSLKHWYQLGDGDINFALVPEHGAGLTKDNFRAVAGGRAALGIEFDSAEVSAHWRSAWWKRLRNASDEERRTMVDGSRAIVWGLLGVDTEHYAHSELHPVYAIAIEDPHSTSDRDIWHVFVRNWGNEGFCSQFSHNLQNNTTMQILLPQPGASKAAVLSSDVSSAPAGLTWRFASVEHGALLAFELGNAPSRHLFDGEIVIAWTAESRGPGLNMLLTVPPNFGLQIRAHELSANVSPQEEKTTEDATEKFFEALSPAQQQEVSSQLKEEEPSNAGPARKLKPVLPTSRVQPFAYIAPHPPQDLAKTVMVLDQQKVARDLIRSRLICKFEAEQRKWDIIQQGQCASLAKQ